MRALKSLGRHDELVEITDLPPVWTARAIKYQRKGFRPSTVLTSLLDPDKYPADELLALYHERGEIELGYGEIKTHLLQREEAIAFPKACSAYASPSSSSSCPLVAHRASTPRGKARDEPP